MLDITIIGDDTMMDSIILEVTEEETLKSDDIIYPSNGGSVDISLILTQTKPSVNI